MNIYEQINNLIWIFLSIGICAYSVHLKLWGPSGPESGFIPFVAGILIGLCGALLFVSEWIKKSGDETFWENSTSWKRALLVVFCFCGMAYFMPILGFLLTSLFITILLFRLLRSSKWKTVIGLAIVACLSFYLFFNFLFQANLPKGILRF
jgi:putative tricarboxylic transport membrane protein